MRYDKNDQAARAADLDGASARDNALSGADEERRASARAVPSCEERSAGGEATVPPDATGSSDSPAGDCTADSTAKHTVHGADLAAAGRLEGCPARRAGDEAVRPSAQSDPVHPDAEQPAMQLGTSAVAADGPTAVSPYAAGWTQTVHAAAPGDMASGGCVRTAQATKRPAVFTRSERTAAALCCLLGFLFVRYFIWYPRGYFTTLTVLALVGVCRWFLHAQGIAPRPRDRWYGGLVCAFSLVFSITDNDVVKLAAGLFVLAVGAYWVFARCERRERLDEEIGADFAGALFNRPFSGFALAPPALLRAPQGVEKKGSAKYLLLGLLAAVPITAFAALMLVGADAGVEKLLSGAFENLSADLGEWVVQLILCLPVACYLFGMLYQNAHRADAARFAPQAADARAARRRVIPNLVAYTALTPALGLYALFFVSQSRYFLSAFAGALPDGISYADYARRGFFELFALAAANLLFLLVLNRSTANGRRTKPLVVYNLLLCGSTLAMIAVALSKMAMYISRFGLTRLRLYTSLAMLGMAAAFALLLVRQFVPRLNVARGCAGTFLVLFALLCFSQSDYWIARFNVEMYESGRHEELDVDYLLHELSDDALGYLLENCDLSASVDGGAAQIALARCELVQAGYNRFGRYNLSSALTDRALCAAAQKQSVFTLKLTVEDDSTAQTVFGVRYEYAMQAKTLGGGEAVRADGRALAWGETLYLDFPPESFPDGVNGPVQLSIWTLDADGVAVSPALSMTLTPAAGEVLAAELHGDPQAGYSLSADTADSGREAAQAQG